MKHFSSDFGFFASVFHVEKYDEWYSFMNTNTIDAFLVVSSKRNWIGLSYSCMGNTVIPQGASQRIHCTTRRNGERSSLKKCFQIWDQVEQGTHKFRNPTIYTNYQKFYGVSHRMQFVRLIFVYNLNIIKFCQCSNGLVHLKLRGPSLTSINWSPLIKGTIS